MDKCADIDAAKACLTQYLEENKMRKTVERYAVLDALYYAGKHVTVDELYGMMAEDLRVSRVTVYNSLDVLRRANIAVAHQFGSGVEYEFRPFGKKHFHKVCVHCGAVMEFANDAISATLDGLHIRGFAISDIQLTVNGTCAKCRAKILRQRRKNKKQQ